jgi:hypothetical protein
VFKAVAQQNFEANLKKNFGVFYLSFYFLKGKNCSFSRKM